MADATRRAWNVVSADSCTQSKQHAQHVAQEVRCACGSPELMSHDLVESLPRERDCHNITTSTNRRCLPA
jgi:hypothetical protein